MPSVVLFWSFRGRTMSTARSHRWKRSKPACQVPRLSFSLSAGIRPTAINLQGHSQRYRDSCGACRIRKLNEREGFRPIARRVRGAAGVFSGSGFRDLPHVRDFGSLAFFDILLFAVAECHPHAERHKSKRWNQEHYNSSADGSLPIFRSCLCRAVTHGAGLAEGRYGPQRQKSGENGGTKLHFTPSERMRTASGKNIIIRARQTTSAHIVSHFICEISYFICMKKPMISAAFTSDKPIK